MSLKPVDAVAGRENLLMLSAMTVPSRISTLSLVGALACLQARFGVDRLALLHVLARDLDQLVVEHRAVPHVRNAFINASATFCGGDVAAGGSPRQAPVDLFHEGSANEKGAAWPLSRPPTPSAEAHQCVNDCGCQVHDSCRNQENGLHGVLSGKGAPSPRRMRAAKQVEGTRPQDLLRNPMRYDPAALTEWLGAPGVLVTLAEDARRQRAFSLRPLVRAPEQYRSARALHDPRVVGRFPLCARFCRCRAGGFVQQQ
jgi:hypothetical protein